MTVVAPIVYYSLVFLIQGARATGPFGFATRPWACVGTVFKTATEGVNWYNHFTGSKRALFDGTSAAPMVGCDGKPNNSDGNITEMGQWVTKHRTTCEIPKYSCVLEVVGPGGEARGFGFSGETRGFDNVAWDSFWGAGRGMRRFEAATVFESYGFGFTTFMSSYVYDFLLKCQGGAITPPTPRYYSVVIMLEGTYAGSPYSNKSSWLTLGKVYMTKEAAIKAYNFLATYQRSIYAGLSTLAMDGYANGLPTGTPSAEFTDYEHGLMAGWVIRNRRRVGGVPSMMVIREVPMYTGTAEAVTHAFGDICESDHDRNRISNGSYKINSSSPVLPLNVKLSSDTRTDAENIWASSFQVMPEAVV